MIILDFETNSANVHDVIEVAAFRVKFIDNMYQIIESVKFIIKNQLIN